MIEVFTGVEALERQKYIATYDPLEDDKSLVKLLDYMGDDLMVANCARVSLDVWHDEFTTEGKIGNDAGMLKYMAHHEPVPHWSPFAHPQIQFRINVPIFVARQWTRSNVGTTRNEMSRRYVDSPAEFYVPRQHMWRARPDASIKQGSGEHMALSIPDNAKVSSLMRMAASTYQTLLDAQVAPEMARMILPQNMYTMWIETGSLYYWYGFVRQRIDHHAQWEIRQYAESLNAILQHLFPHAWQTMIDRDAVIKKRLLLTFAKLVDRCGIIIPPDIFDHVATQMLVPDFDEAQFVEATLTPEEWVEQNVSGNPTLILAMKNYVKEYEDV